LIPPRPLQGSKVLSPIILSRNHKIILKQSPLLQSPKESLPDLEPTPRSQKSPVLVLCGCGPTHLKSSCTNSPLKSVALSGNATHLRTMTSSAPLVQELARSSPPLGWPPLPRNSSRPTPPGAPPAPSLIAYSVVARPNPAKTTTPQLGPQARLVRLATL